ncbi:hypothetical protein [Halobacteriovorax sp. ZH2_bin.1]|uniref:hypothetical protein n=1 Tax=unclassified Halobacteriovorax TaxID=2639665 RepID=UPI00371F2C6D
MKTKQDPQGEMFLDLDKILTKKEKDTLSDVLDVTALLSVRAKLEIQYAIDKRGEIGPLETLGLSYILYDLARTRSTLMFDKEKVKILDSLKKKMFEKIFQLHGEATDKGRDNEHSSRQ